MNATSATVLPRVLVLMATRNGAAHLERQIDSVLAQQQVDVRLQVRDDASSDATRDVVAAIARRDARVSMLGDHEARGSAGGNFFALIQQADLAEVDYVALSDQDDEWFPDKLARAAAQMHANGASGYSAAVVARWPDGREKVLSQSAAVRAADYLFEGAGQGCTFVIAAALFGRLQAHLRTNARALDAIHYHDWALYALARTAGVDWCFDARPAMVYHQHAGNDTGARASGAGVKRRLALIRSGWYRRQVRAVASLVIAAHPGDAVAARWLTLDAASTDGAWTARWARARFIASSGRRSTVDRCIQLAAVGLGYL